MKCFAADILQVFTEKRQNLAIRWLTEYSTANPDISMIFLKLTNFLRSYVLRSSITCDAIRTLFFC